MTTQEKPTAVVSQRTRTKERKTDGKRVPLAAETIRTTTCPVHLQSSSEYVGANLNGWVFWCRGLKLTTGDPVEVAGHYFVSAAPA